MDAPTEGLTATDARVGGAPAGSAAAGASVSPHRGVAAVGLAELAALVAVVAVAAGLRFVNLATRGTWDADQGHDMLVLRAFVSDGTIPLLGPPTSIGDFHHGALYYYLLAPVVAVFGAEPFWVVAAIAAANVAAVAVTWWLARSIAGPVAGLVAALLMAVSAAAIEESTFIWNPNLIALSSAVALAAAWRAWTTGRVRWWAVAAVGQAVTMHCHVLGAVLLVPLAGLLVADMRRRGPADRAPLVRAAVAGAAIIALSYVPLAISELTNDFAETRAVLAFIAGGGDPSAASPLLRLVVVVLRAIGWPLTGLLTDAPAAALLATAAVVAILAWRARRAGGREREAMVWFGATLAWCTVALALAASSLATVVPGLPNDHYHAFLDPIVFVVAGVGAAALWRAGPAPRLVAGAAVALVVAFNVAIWPPAVAPDRGWPAARQAAERIAAAVGTDRFSLVGLPVFKSTDAYGFPLVEAGLVPATGGGTAPPGAPLVVVCDRLFEEAIGSRCGGPAEDGVAAARGDFSLRERFDASPRTAVSIYVAR